MDFRLSSDQALLKSTARKLSEERFRASAFKWKGEYPAANEKILRDQGFFAVSLPQEYGGGGLTLLEELLVLEEVGRVCPDTASALTLAGPPRIIAEIGSESLKRRYLPGFCREGKKIGIAISEAEAGSAVTELRTKARAESGKVILDGGKIFISHADVCAAFLTFVRFEEGIGAVLIDEGTPGLELGKPDINMAGHRQYTLFFDGCEIPEENVLTRGENGFKRLIQAFNAERCLSAAWAVSIALCAFDFAVEYARDRKQFGRRIGDFQGIRWMLAEMAMKIEAARLLTYQAATDSTRLKSSMAKAMASEMVEKVSSDALQIFGAYGYIREHPLEYLYRLARGRKIAGGTLEVQKNMMGDELLRKGFHKEE
ncbi:MAG: acyl-CoA dehydrogenase family protein [Deltaproteobacteria bacterium]|nr:acyl-CoA dehydrogenase family protein [Deltaproteobacteria bacterium]